MERQSTLNIIRDHAPSFAICVRALIDKFNVATWWSPPVEFRDGMVIAKPRVDVANGFFGKDDHYDHHPDFILNDAKQMKRLRGAVDNALHGKPYFNPFWRETGWYIVIAEYDGGLFEGQVADEIRRQYEAGGNRALVITDSMEEPDIARSVMDFIGEFRSCHDIDETPLDFTGGLSDTALKCLASPFQSYRCLDDAEKARVIDEITDEFHTHQPLMDWNSVDDDLDVWRSMAGTESIHFPCFVGNTLINTFIRSRFDCRQRKGHGKTLNSVWADKELIRSVMKYEFETNNGRYHSNRILSKMLFKHSYRVVSNLSQAYIYMRCRPYAVKGGIFYDPCAGWGGRMLAAYNFGMKYVAIDANKKLVGELRELAKFMDYDAEIAYGDSSDPECVKEIMKGRKADLSFTCPPYWNEEWYSDDPFQSNVKCKSKSDWHKRFLYPMIMNTLNATAGVFILSCDEKTDLEHAPGTVFELMDAENFNGKREDTYYLVKRK